MSELRGIEEEVQHIAFIRSFIYSPIHSLFLKSTGGGTRTPMPRGARS